MHKQSWLSPKQKCTYLKISTELEKNQTVLQNKGFSFKMSQQPFKLWIHTELCIFNKYQPIL